MEYIETFELLKEKAGEFALGIMRLCDWLNQEKRLSLFASRLVLAGTEIGSNIARAEAGWNAVDCIAELQVALERCSETSLLLEAARDKGYLMCDVAGECLRRCDELRKILILEIGLLCALPE